MAESSAQTDLTSAVQITITSPENATYTNCSVPFFVSYSIDQSKLPGPLYRIEFSSDLGNGVGGPGKIYDQRGIVPANDTISQTMSLYPGKYSLSIHMHIVYLIPYMRNGTLVTDEYSMTNFDASSSTTVNFLVDPNPAPTRQVSPPKNASATPAPQPMPNTWANAEPMLFNTGTYGAYAAVANGKIYAVGRPDDTPGFLGQAPECIQVYDPSADSWAQKASMLPEYGFHAVASCQSKIYDFNAAQVYDITQDSWSPISNMPAGIGIGVQPVTIGKSIYVIGGASGAWWGGNEIYNSAYMYDCLSNSWSEIASIPQEVAYYGAAAWDGKVYVIGGTTQEPQYGPIKPCNLVQIYNPQTNQWSQGAPMPSGLTYFSAAELNGTNQRIYVFGGYTEDASTVPYKYTSVATSQAYDPALNKWSTVKQLPAARYGASTVSLNGRIYVLSGSANSTNSSKDVQVYTPEDYVAPPNPTPTPTPAPTPTATLTPSLSPTLTPSPSVPEFPTWTIFPLVVAAILLAAFLKRKVKKI